MARERAMGDRKREEGQGVIEREGQNGRERNETENNETKPAHQRDGCANFAAQPSRCSSTCGWERAREGARDIEG